MVLATPSLPEEHLELIIRKASIDAIVTDDGMTDLDKTGVDLRVNCGPELGPAAAVEAEFYDTEWVLLTSGTTGAPKLVLHNLVSLTAAIAERSNQEAPMAWATFYDIRRYGGLQIFLRAAIAATTLLLSDAKEPLKSHLVRLGGRGITHISGTPSHWRRVLWSPKAHSISPAYVRLSGEIADQTILDNLHAAFPGAAIGHAYASTEGGVGFAVDDVREGFPAAYVDQGWNGVAMKVVDGSLFIHSRGVSAGYLGNENVMPIDEQGFLDTGDLVELRDDRYYFVGRKGGIINVGGLKVHPEEVEAVINRHPDVRMSHVRPKKNPLMGNIVVADILLKNEIGQHDARAGQIKHEISELCRKNLPEYKVPVTINIVAGLNFGDSGKLVRSNA